MEEIMVMETYYRKRSKKAHVQPSMEMDEKEVAQDSLAAIEPEQLQENNFLIPEGDEGDNTHMQNHIRVGDFYEIDHSHLPPRTPSQLRSFRVAMVCEMTEMKVGVRFPSMESLRAFLNYKNQLQHPDLDVKFVMGSALAAKVLIRLVPAEVFLEEKHFLPFWLIKSVADGSCNVKKESKGLSEALKDNGMVTWGVRRQVKYLGRHKESGGSGRVCNEQKSSSSFVNGVEESAEEDEKNGDDDDDQENSKEEEEEEDDQEDESEEGTNKAETNNSKRKRYSFRNLSMQKAKKAKIEIRKKKKKQTRKKNQNKKNKGRMIRSIESFSQRNPKDRWSAERYKLAEQNLLEVMKSKGATTETPILRPQLRAEARKRIGDTGLLDHLLKHMAGKLAPGGQERFRRRHNPAGAMEYWLESADLVNLRREAGVTDPYWVPPPGWKPGDPPTQDPTCAAEMKLLKDDISNIKRGLELMVTKLQLEEELRKLRREIHEISSKEKQQENQTIVEESKGGDEKYKEQLMNISNLVKDIERNLEKLTPDSFETASKGSSLMAASDSHMMREKTEVQRDTKSIKPQVQDALIDAAEGETQQLVKNQKNDQNADEKAAKIQRLKSGFRICKPQGTFLWPNMVNTINNSSSFVQVQVEVPTPPSVSSTVPPQLPYGGGGGYHHQYQPPPPAPIVKPLAAKRGVTVAVSTSQSCDDNGDAINSCSTTNTPTSVNQNDALMNLDDAMPLFGANRLPWERCGTYDDTRSSIAEVGSWLALSTTALNSTSADLNSLN